MQTSIIKSRQHSRKTILNMIDFGGYEWNNENYNCKLTLTSKHYPSFPHLVYDLIIRLPDNAHSKSWNQQIFGNKKIVEKFSAVVHQKQTQYLGWELKKI